MRRYELWIDDDGKLVLSEFRSLKSENESRVLRGSETYNTIKLLSSKSIVNIKEKDDYLSIEFENYIININDLGDVLTKRGINPLITIVKKYIETNSLKKSKKKKVTRKNKHTGRKIIATGLTVLTLSSSIYMFKDNISAMANNVSGYFDDMSISTSEKSVELSELFDEVNSTVEDNSSHITNLSVNNEDKNIVLSNLEYEETQKVSIDYSDRSDTNKAYKTKAYYGDLIEKYSVKYGVDPDLVTAIATQERGVHGTTIDVGGAIGLMQIQYNVWANKPISAYNFDTGQKESFIIDDEKLSDIDYNIKVGCMYLQNCMEYMNYNTVAAVQCYNMGSGSMSTILKAYSSACGKSIKEILSNPEDIGWLEYRHIVKIGDPDYVENVFSYLGENSNIKNTKKDGTVVNININNKVSSKKIY
ncbi:MAG: transglycosylase SLT domain-containing protein [Bacilli bacterium]|nr:transglycosylase SLT domain-containing protein [Bacilli bacterium]